MDPDAFTTTLFKWDPRPILPYSSSSSVAAASTTRSTPLLDFCTVAPPPRELEKLFQCYGVRYYTAAKIAELGFTVRTLVDMKDDELEDMMNSLSHFFRWELLVGERYGIKAAVRAERRRIDDEDIKRRNNILHSNNNDTTTIAIEALSLEGLSEEPVVQREKEAAGSGGGSTWEVVALEEEKNKQQRRRWRSKINLHNHEKVLGEENNDEGNIGGGGCEREREHPFIVTEPGEVARGKKNGLDYLFHLYEQCRVFLIQVQAIAKDQGEKCPTKVTNQVFRYAKNAGATYINKPKMRHYVHCYALHCLDEDVSNELRKVLKERGENVGAWRQSCYKPLVAIASRQDWDIDAIFNAHPRLSIWYVPTKLRQLCHLERNNATASSSVSVGSGHLPF